MKEFKIRKIKDERQRQTYVYLLRDIQEAENILERLKKLKIKIEKEALTCQNKVKK